MLGTRTSSRVSLGETSSDAGSVRIEGPTGWRRPAVRSLLVAVAVAATVFAAASIGPEGTTADTEVAEAQSVNAERLRFEQAVESASLRQGAEETGIEQVRFEQAARSAVIRQLARESAVEHLRALERVESDALRR